MTDPSGTIQTKSGCKARVVVEPTGAVNVHVSPEVLYNLQATPEIVRLVMTRLGHPTCHSGLQLNFRAEALKFDV